jgi:hypothetical protein
MYNGFSSILYLFIDSFNKNRACNVDIRLINPNCVDADELIAEQYKRIIFSRICANTFDTDIGL